jgi:hypothetical protein
MFTTLRIYTGAPGVAARIAAKRESIEKTFRGISGFAGYRLIDMEDGFASVTICETREGCEQSANAAAAWLKENLPDVVVPAPRVITGESLLSFGAKPSR